MNSNSNNTALEPKPLTPTLTETIPTVYSLYASTYTELVRISSDDRHILPDHALLAVGTVSDSLNQYDGPLTETAFLEWATGIITPLRTFYGVLGQTNAAIRAALWSVLGRDPVNSLDDYPEVLRELQADVHLWLWESLDEVVNAPTKAKMTTRLWRRAEFHARAWVKRERHRQELVVSHPDLIDYGSAMWISQAELAELRGEIK